MGFSNITVQYIVLDEFPVPFLDGAHTRFGTSIIDAVQDIPDSLFLSRKNGLEANTVESIGSFDTSYIAKRGEHIHKIGVSPGPATGFDARSTNQQRHSPGVLVKVLFPHESVAANGDAMIG